MHRNFARREFLCDVNASQLEFMAIDSSKAAGVSVAKRIYRLRTIGCALSLIFVAVTTWPGGWVLWALMGVNGLLWAPIALQLAIRSARPYQAELRNLQLDCVFAGAWVVAMQFSVLPSLLLLSMVAMNSVTARGIRFLLSGLLASALGIVGTVAVAGFTITVDTLPEVIWACVPMLVIYPFMVGWSSYSLAGQLLRQQKALSIVTGFNERMLTPFDGWMYRLAQVFFRCRCGSSKATLALVRIDDFQSLCDKHGPVLMEALSIRLGQLINAEIRTTDLVCMKQPGEFLVLLLQAGTVGARSLCERVQAFFIDGVTTAQGLPKAQLCVGLAEFSFAFNSENEWLQLAEERSVPAQLEAPLNAAASSA